MCFRVPKLTDKYIKVFFKKNTWETVFDRIGDTYNILKRTIMGTTSTKNGFPRVFEKTLMYLSVSFGTLKHIRPF